EREYKRTSQIIESRFDENVRKVFKNLRDELPRGLAGLDRDIAQLVDGYLSSTGVSFQRSKNDGRVFFEVAPDASLPPEVGPGRRFATGDARSLNNAEALNLVHPLVRVAIEDARKWNGGPIVLRLPSDPDPDLASLSGRVGVICVA